MLDMNSCRMVMSLSGREQFRVEDVVSKTVSWRGRSVRRAFQMTWICRDSLAKQHDVNKLQPFQPQSRGSNYHHVYELSYGGHLFCSGSSTGRWTCYSHAEGNDDRKSTRTTAGSGCRGLKSTGILYAMIAV